MCVPVPKDDSAAWPASVRAAGAGRATFCRVADSGTDSKSVTAFCSEGSMTFLPRVPGESGGDDASHDHEDEADGDQGQRRAPAAVLRADVRLVRVREDLRGQRRVGAPGNVRI